MRFASVVAATAMVGASMAENHIVSVSDKSGSLTFSPDSLAAAEGDTVTFVYWPMNHSVAVSSFSKPCEPLANSPWSGYVATKDTTKPSNEIFVMPIMNASAPIWFYCSQGHHCQAGMVGVINPPKSGANTLEAYKNASAAAPNNITPMAAPGFGGRLMQVNATAGATGANGAGNSSTSTGSTNGTSTGPGVPKSTGAAAQLAGSAAFAGLSTLFAYLLI
ncbi:hypothetical protein ACEQ8H_004478 [Pleosporales sp. CAS-2024a]